MAGGLSDIIARLERQKTAIERALAALREVEGAAEPVSAPATTQPASTPAKRKGGMTPEGRKRLAEAMKRRWAVKRAASAVKKTVRKQRAAKKAA